MKKVNTYRHIIMSLILTLSFLQFDGVHAQDPNPDKSKVKKLDTPSTELDSSCCLDNANKRIIILDYNDTIDSYKTRESFENMLKNKAKEKFTDFIKNDTLNTKLEEYRKDIFTKYKSDEDALLLKKRTTLFNEYKQTDQLKLELHSIKTPKYWLIVLIIFVSGIIGGIARTNWSLLLDLEKDVKNIEEQLNECKGKMDKTDGSVRFLEKTGVDFVSKMNIIQKKIANVDTNIVRLIKTKDEKPRALFASIIFGIIASSIAILALKLTESKILDFQKPIDYFVFWGWCVLGAIYAKKWIESLYGRIAKSINS